MQLEEICLKCTGTGTLSGYDEDNNLYTPLTNTCKTCNGTGIVPTDEGEAILEFLRKHLIVKFNGGINIRDY